MARLELYVKFLNGTGRVVATERNDAEGRREIDRQAFKWLSQDGVERCEVTETTRVAGFLRRSR